MDLTESSRRAKTSVSRAHTGTNSLERSKMRDKGSINPNTEKLVTALRLKKIEREHKSVGSLLDTRKMYDLDDPDAHRPPKMKSEKARAVVAKREAVTEKDIPVDALMQDMEERARQEKRAADNADFATEELLWKNKCNQEDYFLKRRFERPELHNFFVNLNAAQRAEFKIKCRETLRSICKRERKKCFDRLSRMSDLFHVEANEHRAHCQYMLKLHKAIRCEYIEDPVLIEMKSVVDKAHADDAEAERRAQALVRMYEEAAGKVQSETAAPTPATTGDDTIENEAKEANKEVVSKEEKVTATLKMSNTKSMKRTLSQKSLPRSGKLTPLTVDTGLKKTASSKSLIVSPVVSPSNRSKMKSPTAASAKEQVVVQVPEENMNILDKLKIKRAKIGTMDPKSILTADVERLQQAPIIEPKKSFDKSDILQRQTTSWMSQTLQSSQIKAASGGFASQIPSWKNIPEFQSSMLNVLRNQPVTTTFDEFQQIFERYVNEQKFQEVPPEIEARDELDSLPDATEVSDTMSVHSQRRLQEEQVDIVEQMAVMDPLFKDFLKLAVRKKPASQKLNIQTEKIKKTFSASIQTQSRIGLNLQTQFTSDKNNRQGFHNRFHVIADLAESDSNVSSSVVLSVDKEHSFDETFDSQEHDCEIDSPDIGSPSSPSVTNRTRAISRSSLSRSSRRRRRNESSSGSFFTENEDPVKVKLEDIWNVLQTPMFGKLSFMRKYASVDHAKDFGRAVDIWGEAAASIFVRSRILYFIEEKLSKGHCIFPVCASTILALIDEPFRPSSFVNTAPELISTSLEPLSTTLLRHLWQYTNELFGNYSGEASDANVLHSILRDVVEKTNITFKATVKKAAEELDDVIAISNVMIS